MPLAIRELQKSFGEKKVLRGVSHVFPETGASAVSGPSGCGKTTLLRVLLGLETPDGGEVLPPAGARTAAVFQEDRLIMHMTAAANIALVAPGLPAGEISALLEAVGLPAGDRQRVSRYSGGMRRRVALARALAVRPGLLFLDEPFTGLDDAVKERCAALVRERMREGLTVVVTHDGDEARLLGCTDELVLPPPPGGRNMNTEAYLERIGYTGPREATRAALFALQRAHLYAVPYENLDILAGKRLSLEEGALFDKIVTRRRGGYCFELNELFGRLLRALGFQVTDLFARFLKGEEGIPMRRHHVLLVREPGSDDAFIADVGVGSGSPMEPVLLERGPEQERDGEGYRFSVDPFLGWVLEEKKRGLWGPVYSFTLERQLPVDFAAASFFCEAAPESIFNKEPMLSLRRPGGRVTLDGDVFRVFEGDSVREERAADEAGKARLVAERFGIVL